MNSILPDSNTAARFVWSEPMLEGQSSRLMTAGHTPRQYRPIKELPKNTVSFSPPVQN
jgi:hypothetical protein